MSRALYVLCGERKRGREGDSHVCNFQHVAQKRQAAVEAAVEALGFPLPLVSLLYKKPPINKCGLKD